MRKIRFTKMHGAGNDYVYINTMMYDVPDPRTTAIMLSDRHKGIGSDGMVLIGEPGADSGADFSMRIFNADGSEAMMCGNASRCIGKYVYENKLTAKTTVRLETLSGVKTLWLHVDDDNHVETVTVDMLAPSTQCSEQYDESCKGLLHTSMGTVEGTFVSMGNPHFVIFTDRQTTADVTRLGSELETNPVFPQRCNIEFARVEPDGSIRTRVWERGSGITQACGTGACATAVAASLTGRSSHTSRIVMDGGTLNIEWRTEDNHVYMTGGASSVFEGEIEIL